MNNSKTSTIVAGIKELQGDINASEGRLAFIRTETEKLRREKEQLITEIESLKTAVRQDTEAKLLEVRKAKEESFQERKTLDAQKAEFLLTLTTFKQERNAFEDERQKSLNMKSSAEEKLVKIDQFIRLIKSASQGL